VWVRGGDTLVVADAAHGLSILDPHGRYVRAVRPPPGPGGRPAQPIGLLDDGTIVAIASSGGAPGPPVAWSVLQSSMHVYRFPTDGLPDSLATFPGAPAIMVSAGGGMMPRRIPFSAYPAWSATGDRIFLAGGAEPEVRVWGSDGSPERVIRWSAADLVLTPEHVARYREHLLGNARTPDRRRLEEQFLTQVTMPARMPATGEVSAIHVAEDGTLWVQAFRPPWQEETQWQVFSPAGVWLGSVVTPPRLTVHQVGRDFVLGSWRDDMGIEYVQMYRIEP
jgi:hypothetical protein